MEGQWMSNVNINKKKIDYAMIDIEIVLKK